MHTFAESAGRQTATDQAVTHGVIHNCSINLDGHQKPDIWLSITWMRGGTGEIIKPIILHDHGYFVIVATEADTKEAAERKKGKDRRSSELE